MFRKFSTADILDAHMADDARQFAKSAHRAVFHYTPRPGYLYVRSRAISSRCNDNFDYFGPEEIEKSYLTFIGKPVFVNHHNDDHRRSRGVIIDAALHKDVNPDGSPDTWAEVLHEVDAVKFPKLAHAILSKEVNRTSMGCDVQLSKCSVCHNEASSPLEYCDHIPGMKGKRVAKLQSDGSRTAQLVFEICSGLSFFENSLLVEQPADPTAFFLGEVEYGPGLESLTSSIPKTAARETAWVSQPSPRPMQRTAKLSSSPSSVWNLIQRAAAEAAPVIERNANRMPPTIWDLIKKADWLGDDLDNDFPLRSRTAGMGSPPGTLNALGPADDDHDHFLKTHGVSYHQGVQNIMSSFLNSHHAAAHEAEELGAVGPHQEAHHEGLNWYKEFHKTARMITGGHAVKGSNEVKGGNAAMGAGLLAVTSPQSQLPENARKASLTFRAGHGLGGPSGVAPKPTAKKPDPGPPNPRDPHYHPGIMSTGDQASKANRIMGVRHNGDHAGQDAGEPTQGPDGKWSNHPNIEHVAANPGTWSEHPDGPEHHSTVLGTGSPKVSNFSHTIEHGGDDPEHVVNEAKQGRDGRRVTVDVHALSAYLGKRATKEDYTHVGGDILKADRDGGFRENHRYRQVADAYREAADRLKSEHGIHVEPHQVQAVTWVSQRNQNYEEKPGEKASMEKATDKWHSHVQEHHPDFSEHTHWRMSSLASPNFTTLAFGETKAPKDVDTLRAENCTVCGNSTAFDGVQCQVCGYMAPPRPFGDPDVDTAKANDQRKQVLDGDVADPSDPNQQLGNQIGDPDELEDQAADALSGGQIPPLTCMNCQTGIQPAPPQSAGGEPPYPAEGDVCPVCKSGELTAGGDSGADEDVDGDGIPDDEETDKPGDGQDAESDNSDDDEDDAPPFAKGKKK